MEEPPPQTQTQTQTQKQTQAQTQTKDTVTDTQTHAGKQAAHTPSQIITAAEQRRASVAPAEFASSESAALRASHDLSTKKKSAYLRTT
jgi:hypothetical protein